MNYELSLFAVTRNNQSFIFDDAHRVIRSDDSFSSATFNYDCVKKIDSVTLSELNFHDLSSPPKTVEFLCTRDVATIGTANGWCYVSCSKFSSCTCAPCHDENAVGVARYRVEILVTDVSDTAMFVAFNGEMNKLTSGLAAAVSVSMVT
ncbi:unnamed protein product [Brassica oleracea]|uniref:(rape) hypothetical protein n=1 Tax=Brassica napus TaxID=3708 RepID=A0A816RHL2_BRANA|nr:unnamed protein product [Brassica napus]